MKQWQKDVGDWTKPTDPVIELASRPRTNRRSWRGILNRQMSHLPLHELEEEIQPAPDLSAWTTPPEEHDAAGDGKNMLSNPTQTPTPTN